MTIDERIAAELRSHAPEVDGHVAWTRIQSLAPVRRRGRAMRLVSVPVAALGFLLLGVLLVRSLSPGPAPASEPQNPFLGTWVTIDGDGSTPTMTVGVSGDGTVEIVVLDDFASVCSGARSTMTGTGRLEGITELVIPTPVYTCDDGSQPVAVSGPPLEEQLGDLTFALDPVSDALTDNFGSVWKRAGAVVPSPEPTVSAGIWPQSSPEEVLEAQRLAVAGDPRYAWQVDAGLAAQADPYDAEIFVRFLEEELGWEEFRSHPFASYEAGAGFYINIVYVRCAPGQTNPLYPNDPWGAGCAPTIDQFRYETVTIDVTQLGQRGPSGIWVVTRWTTLPPVAQVVPPTDAETTALLRSFLQARSEGEGAQEYLNLPEEEIPLLYATTAGSTYERSEFEVVDGPEWPEGWMQFRVQLFADEDETEVEQYFSLERDGTGRLLLGYPFETVGPDGLVSGSTENGQAVPVERSFLDGEVTFRAAYPWDWSFAGWDHGPSMTTLLAGHSYAERLGLLADPRPIGTGCEQGPAPTDGEALAQSIRSDPDFQITASEAVSVGEIEGLRMDLLVATGASICDYEGLPQVVTETGLEQGSRMRLYLLDLPEGLSARILAITIVAPEARFEEVMESAVPIVDSIEFHAP